MRWSYLFTTLHASCLRIFYYISFLKISRTPCLLRYVFAFRCHPHSMLLGSESLVRFSSSSSEWIRLLLRFWLDVWESIIWVLCILIRICKSAYSNVAVVRNRILKNRKNSSIWIRLWNCCIFFFDKELRWLGAVLRPAEASSEAAADDLDEYRGSEKAEEESCCWWEEEEGRG